MNPPPLHGKISNKEIVRNMLMTPHKKIAFVIKFMDISASFKAFYYSTHGNNLHLYDLLISTYTTGNYSKIT